MSKPFLLCLLVLCALAATAGGLGLKPGLWEIKVVKQIVDGRDVTAQIAEGAAKMQQLMANMTPEQRARMQGVMPKAGVGFGDTGDVRICVSPEFANRDQPVIDKEGHCPPASVQHDGNTTTYEFSCTSNGSTRQGKGQSIASGDVILNRVDMTTQAANGQAHIMHNESEMHFLGADCGDVKPIEAPAK